MGLTEGAKESIYWTALLGELGFDGLVEVMLLNDNNGALNLAENPVFHIRSKHIGIRRHFIRKVLTDKRLRIAHVPSDGNVADMLTKSLSKPRLDRCVSLAGMRQIADHH